MSNEAQRKAYLVDWAQRLDGAAARGVFGKPIRVTSAQVVNGPRAGALLLSAGFDAGALLRALQADDCATLRQLIPYGFAGAPIAFMVERTIRVEAGWPKGLADDDIPLKALGQHPTNGGRWLVGRNERGDVLTAGLDDHTPHWLVSGQTGSGKSTALVSAIAQLAKDPDNRLLLIDAKHGASFRAVASVRGRIGPVADDILSARGALAWTVREMAVRYSGGRDTRRVVVVIDEVQAIADDPLASESLRQVVSTGRGCGVHVIAATQHPVVAALGGPTVGRNLVGRLALRVADAEASRVAVGASQPRADYLLGRGDGYGVAPGAVHRVQCAYLDSEPERAEPDLTEWPEADAELPSGWPVGTEVGAALLSVSRGEGRAKFQRACSALGVKVADNNKAVRLLGLARDTLAWLGEHGADVCLSEDDDTPTGDE